MDSDSGNLRKLRDLHLSVTGADQHIVFELVEKESKKREGHQREKGERKREKKRQGKIWRWRKEGKNGRERG